MGKPAWVVAALCGLPLSLTLAMPAHGDGDAISGYIGAHGAEICGYMNDQPNLSGVKHAVDHILETSAMPQDQTGRLLAGSVTSLCPEDGDLVEEFVRYVQHRQQQGGALGLGPVLGS